MSIDKTMQEIERLAQNVVNASHEEGRQEAFGTQPMQFFYERTHSSMDTLLSRIRQELESRDARIAKAIELADRLDGYLTSPEQVALRDELVAALTADGVPLASEASVGACNSTAGKDSAATAGAQAERQAGVACRG
jgi:hypothetical protein